MRRFAPRFIGYTNDGDLLDRRMPEQDTFYLNTGDILSAADDHILEPVANFDVAVGVNDGRIAGIHPASPDHVRGRFRIQIIALHHRVSTYNDLPGRLAVAAYFTTVRADNAQLSGCDKLNPLPRLQSSTLFRGQPAVCLQRFADRNERGCLGQTVELRDLPSQVALDAFDRFGCRRRSSRQHPHSTANAAPQVPGRIRNPNQDCGSGAEKTHRFPVDQLQYRPRINFPDTNMSGSNGCHGPNESPSVRMKHGQCPEIAVGCSHMDMNQGARDVDIRIPVRDHDALRL
jgi:hypothetical protein